MMWKFEIIVSGKVAILAHLSMNGVDLGGLCFILNWSNENWSQKGKQVTYRQPKVNFLTHTTS